MSKLPIFFNCANVLFALYEINEYFFDEIDKTKLEVLTIPIVTNFYEQIEIVEELDKIYDFE